MALIKYKKKIFFNNMSEQESSSNSFIYMLTGISVSLSILFLVCMEIIFDSSVYTGNAILCYCLIVSVLPIIFAFVLPKFAKMIAMGCTALTLLLILVLFLRRNTVSFYLSGSGRNDEKIASAVSSKINVIFLSGSQIETKDICPPDDNGKPNPDENSGNSDDKKNEDESKTNKVPEKTEEKGPATPEKPEENEHTEDNVAKHARFIENEKKDSKLFDNNLKKSKLAGDENSQGRTDVKIGFEELTKSISDEGNGAAYQVVTYAIENINQITTTTDLKALYSALNSIYYSKLGKVKKLLLYIEVPNADQMKELGFTREVIRMK